MVIMDVSHETSGATGQIIMCYNGGSLKKQLSSSSLVAGS